MKATAVVLALLHIAWLLTTSTWGVGSTCMVKLCDAPVQLAADGVTVTVATIIALVLFVAVNDAMSPLPLAARPMPGALFVQLNVVPLTVPLKLVTIVPPPLQIF